MPWDLLIFIWIKNMAKKYSSFFTSLENQEEKTFNVLRNRIKKIKKLYRLTWKEIADEIDCIDTELIRFVNTKGKKMKMARVLLIEKFLDRYNERD